MESHTAKLYASQIYGFTCRVHLLYVFDHHQVEADIVHFQNIAPRLTRSQSYRCIAGKVTDLCSATTLMVESRSGALGQLLLCT